MRIRLSGGAFLLVCLIIAAGHVSMLAQAVIAIQAGRLIDGSGGPVIEDAVVIVRGDRIEAVGKASEISIPAGAEVVDLSQDTVMPGLIDAHAHLSIRPDVRALEGQLGGMEEPDALQMGRIVRNIRVQLLSGVTSLYVVGEVHYNDIYTRQVVEAGIIPGPRIYPSGNFITTTAGHGPSEYRVTNGPWEMRTFVRKNYEAGAHHMKFTITDRARVGPNDGAPYATGESNFTREEIEAAVDELHRLGIQATAHANGESIRLALEAGVDSIQHGYALTGELIDLFLQKGAGFVNTFTIRFQGVFDEWNFLDTEAENIQQWIDRCRQVIESTLAGDQDRTNEVQDRWRQLRMANDRGVKVGVGTDSMHGLLALEMENLVKSGLTPLQAITAATGVNAKIVGIDQEVGTLEKGKLADIISIQGKPDQDLRNLGKVNFLMVGGKIYSDLSFR